MSVEDSAIIATDTATPLDTAPNEDTALSAVWDRLERDNGAARDDTGKFASTKPVEETGPLEGGEGEAGTAGAEPSTPAPTGVPLPSNWRGIEAAWDKIPDDLKPVIKAHEDKLHQTLSTQGQQLATFKPIADTLSKYQEYFNGERGSYKQHEAVDFLFAVQKGMDENPVQTITEIIDLYNLRPQLAQIFGQGGDAVNQQLLAKIDQLERNIRNGAGVNIDERITSKLKETREIEETESLLSRASKDMPLYEQVPETDLVFFIEKSWAKLGQAASKEAVLKSAYDMAVNADPELRAKAAALKGAAQTDQERVAAAKRSNATNIGSTTSGKAKTLTEDEELALVWDKNNRG